MKFVFWKLLLIYFFRLGILTRHAFERCSPPPTTSRQRCQGHAGMPCPDNPSLLTTPTAVPRRDASSFFALASGSGIRASPRTLIDALKCATYGTQSHLAVVWSLMCANFELSSPSWPTSFKLLIGNSTRLLAYELAGICEEWQARQRGSMRTTRSELVGAVTKVFTKKQAHLLNFTSVLISVMRKGECVSLRARRSMHQSRLCMLMKREVTRLLFGAQVHSDGVSPRGDLAPW